MSKRRSIKSYTPIPTNYTTLRNDIILLRSKLEAKWAFVLDHTPGIKSWSYEPYQYSKTSKNEQLPEHSDFIPQKMGQSTAAIYTPDFGASYHGTEYILEIKPTIPTDAYLSFVASFNIPNYIIIAGWFPNFSVHSSNTQMKEFVKILFEENTRFIRANQHRFDLRK